jgi:hypothetical protein
MAYLYANENFPLKVVFALRDLGHDVLTSHEAGKANQSLPDKEVLAFACQNKRSLLTINRRDFIKLHRTGVEHAGMIVCTQDPDVLGQAARIHQAILSENNLTGKVIRVNRPHE